MSSLLIAARAHTIPPRAAGPKARWAFRIALLAMGATVGAPRPLAAAPADRPPSAEEQARFAEGVRLLQAGDARGAERAFKAGYAVTHDPAFLVRMGEAEERAGAPGEAAESYARYLRQSPEASDRHDIERRIQKLVPAGAQPASPGPTDAAEVPRSLPSGAAAGSTPVPPASGIAPAGSEPAPGGGSTPPPMAAGSSAPPPPPPRPSMAMQATDDEQLRALVDENAPPRSRLNTAAWVSSGVTVLLLGTAAFYGAKAGEKNGDVNRLLGNFNEKTGMPVEYATVAAEYEADVRDGRHDDRMAKGFAIAAGVAAATSIVLFIVDAARSADTPVESPGPRRDAPSALRLVPASVAASASRWGLAWSF